MKHVLLKLNAIKDTRGQDLIEYPGQLGRASC